MNKDTRIKAEVKRLKSIFEKGEAGKIAISEHLINNAAFLSVTLDELKEIINRDGCVQELKGSMGQTVRKASAESEEYAKFAKAYISIIKLLADLLPESAPDVDALTEFLK